MAEWVEGARSLPVFFCIIFLTGYRISKGVYTKILDETEGIVNIGITWDIVVWEVSQIENLADVAELADAQASGACGLRLVEVRLLSSALNHAESGKISLFGLISRTQAAI